MNKITIIVPVYDVEQYIKQCFDSVTQQDYPSVECIFINDCSSDSSLNILEEQINSYDGLIQFRILNQQNNQGAAAARNLGVHQATGEYIYFLDSDDRLTADCLTTLSAAASQYPGVDMVQGDVNCEEDKLEADLTIGSKNLPAYTEDRHWIRSNFFINLPVPPWNKLIRRSMLLNYNIFFKEGIVNEDVLWMFDMCTHIRSIAFVVAETYFHRANQSSVMRSPKNERKRIASFMFILRYCLLNIRKEIVFLDNFGILKQYQHNRLLKISNDSQRFFKEEFNNCIYLALKTNKVPLIFKPMYFFLFLPRKAFIRMLFVWNKGLGILYRISKRLDRNNHFSNEKNRR